MTAFCRTAARLTATLLPALLLASPARAGEAWTTVSEGPIVVKTRSREGSPVQEVWAEAELEASARDIQETLLDPNRFARFMPYVKEARTVGRPDRDGGIYVYTRVELPLLGSRDYVVKSYCEEQVDAEGRGTFRQRWVATPDRLPHRHTIERLRLNEGSWQVRAVGKERAHVIYRFLVDPGRLVPAFAADLGNRSGVQDTLRAVEKEAQRRATARRSGGGGGQKAGAH